jgi:hypothetical protein
MTHPITVPPELVKQWFGDYYDCPVSGEISGVEAAIATRAAQWGSDQELDGCFEEMNTWGAVTSYGGALADDLRSARRPKPPSLKEQALAALNEIEDEMRGPTTQEKIIRRALEALPE